MLKCVNYLSTSILSNHKNKSRLQDGLSDPKKHVQNMRNNLELVIQDISIVCKILPAIFHGSF